MPHNTTVIALFFLALFAAVGRVIYWAIRAGKRHAKQVDAAWREVAVRLEASFTAAQGPWYASEPRRLEAKLDGCELLVDHFLVSAGKSSQVYTRIRATAAFTQKLGLTVYKKDFFSSFGDLLETSRSALRLSDS